MINMIICIILSVGVWYTMTLFHELGHVIALLLTKYIFCREYKEKLNIKMLVSFRNGFTQSSLYAYLENSKQYSLIKLNAISGYLFGIVIALIIFALALYSALFSWFIENIPPSIYAITIIINLLIWSRYLRKNIETSSDLKNYTDPETFKYNKSIDINSNLLPIAEYALLFSSILLSLVIYFIILTVFTLC